MILSSAASCFEKYIEIIITHISPIISCWSSLVMLRLFHIHIYIFFFEYIIDSEVYLPPALTI